MNILFLGYWNVDDPLTSATIIPHLKVLKSFPQVKSVIFTNTQREPVKEENIRTIEDLGVIYKPLYSKNIPINILNKANDFRLFPKLILSLIKEFQIDLIIARGAPAGGLAYLVWKKTKTSFVVESYEPHADYMKAAGVWKNYDFRYLYQKHLEKKQKQYAAALITVSHNYKKALEKEGVNKSKVYVAPCSVDTNKFFIDETLGQETKKKLNIPATTIVGVYVGKFGGLYYEDEAFQLFKSAFEYYENFYLLILTAQDKNWIKMKCEEFNIPKEKYIQRTVPHEEINSYLNASDFAFAPYKKTDFAQYLSPVKVGEYWACGLPVILTEGVGDDSEIIKKFGGGVLYSTNAKEVFSELEQMRTTLSRIFYRNLTIKYRSLTQVEAVYEKLLDKNYLKQTIKAL